MPFAPEYVRSVLSDNFADAKAFFAAPLMDIHSAHLVMLASRGIVTSADARALSQAVQSITADDLRQAAYDGSVEDLFFLVDRLLAGRCGERLAGRLHTARSRNDIDMTMYRMRQRELLLDLFDGTLLLRRSLLDLAARHRDTVFAAHTHTQPAQPTTVAHYLLAVIEQLERDADRLKKAFERTNRCPLGSCAITGTGFPIDRDLTADLLGFAGPTGNTYDSIATVDYLLESLAAATVLLVGLGRVLQDLLLWCTSEFNYLRLGDGFVQISSIMPQKRNPVALEHARALASKALGEAQGVVTAVHNTPFGDVVDTEDDLQPLVFAAFRDATRAVTLVAAAMAAAEIDAPRMEARAGQGWTTLTELADTLVREHDVPFGSAHRIAAALMAAGDAAPGQPLSALLAAASREALGAPLVYEEARLAEILSARHFVAVRRTPGGPAPVETARAGAAAEEALQRDRAWLDERRERLTAAARRLADRSRAF